MMMNRTLLCLMIAVGAGACAAPAVNDATPEQAARIDRKLVRNAVVFGPGAEDGAVVPDISTPCLRAVIVDEERTPKKIVEKHREWYLECDVSLLGIPKKKKAN